ncbi:hypothetical protein Ancab_028884 [Ancistrocladus abbreviatus]
MDNHPKSQMRPFEEHDEATPDGKEGVSNKSDTVAQSSSQNTVLPVNSFSSPAAKQSADSKLEQSSSRWLSREDRDGPILEISARHKSPESRRLDGNVASEEVWDKRETNVGAFNAGQQSGEGVLSRGQGLRDEWITPLSSLKREKGRTKKSKQTLVDFTADFAEDQYVSWREEGDSSQPTMGQAQPSKADQVAKSRGPSEMQREKAQDTPKGQRQHLRPNTDNKQYKESLKKKAGQCGKRLVNDYFAVYFSEIRDSGRDLPLFLLLLCSGRSLMLKPSLKSSPQAIKVHIPDSKSLSRSVEACIPNSKSLSQNVKACIPKLKELILNCRSLNPNSKSLPQSVESSIPNSKSSLQRVKADISNSKSSSQIIETSILDSKSLT